MVGPVIFDAIKRYLSYCGYKVTWVVNVTDVDDKLIVESRARGWPSNGRYVTQLAMQGWGLIETAVATVGLVAAITASGHALLYKRRPQSAFGWIALCFSLPLAGPSDPDSPVASTKTSPSPKL